MTKRHTFSEIPPPTPEDYVRAIDMTCSEENIRDGQSLLGAIDRRRTLDENYEYYVYEVSPCVGVAIEPIDRTLQKPVDEAQNKAHAIMRGMAFAKMFIPRAHDSAVHLGDLVPILPGGLDHIDDVYEKNEAVGRFLVDCGEKGAGAMGEVAADILEGYEAEVVHDVGSQRFFRTGCGLVAYAALRAHALYNQDPEWAAIRAGAHGGATTEWDDELQRLLNE